MLLLSFSCLQAALFGVLYYAAFVVFNRRTDQPMLAAACAFSPMVFTGMITFWATWLDHHAAAYINIGTWLAIIPALWICAAMPFQRDAAIASSLWAAAAIALLFWTFGPTGVESMTNVARDRFVNIGTGDNIVPLDFAKALLSGHVPSPMFGDWLSSDRPPLQTGIFLAFRMPYVSIDTAYQILATTLQMAVVPAMYILGRAAGLPTPQAVALAAIVFFAPMTVINGAFVWPKIITAALLAAAAAIHFTQVYDRAKYSTIAGLAVGALSSGAMLAHGAAGFTLVAFGLAAAISRRWATPRYVMAALLTVVVLYGPWAAYQKFIDPPGDRLLKWQLADVTDYADRRSFSETFADVYRPLTFENHLQRTGAKIGMTLNQPFAPISGADPATVRTSMFYYVLPALGIFGVLGLFSMIAILFTTNRIFGLIFALNVAVWMFLIFNTSGVVVHQSSMFMLLMLPLAAVLALKRFPPILYALVGAQAAVGICFLPY